MPLFPEIAPYRTHMLPVGQGHTLYVEESGNPNGPAAIVLHGGPGSGCNANHRRRFNPATWRIICFDQRGAGRSTPAGELTANTTAHLVEDINAIRTHLGLGKIALYGHSWGSTLALAYAQSHPEHVAAMVVGGIFLATQTEMDWFTQPHGVARLYPNEHATLADMLNNPAPQMFFKALSQAITGGDVAHATLTARQWGVLESLLSTPTPNRAEIEAELALPGMLPRAAIEISYIANNCYLTPNQLLENASRLVGIPLTILQGQLDFVTPPAAAIALHQALPHSRLHLLAETGHSGTPQLEDARVAATEAMLPHLSRK